ncbi:MAG: glycoside hydrolase family 25 protein [Olsenella sp.]|nr:glycoside hydrolase family 25 protein [Olsenella sp.]
MAQMKSGVDRRISANRVRTVRRNNSRRNKFPFVPLIAAVAILLVVALVRLVFFAQPEDMAVFRPADTQLSAAIAESTDVFSSPYDWANLEKDDKDRMTYTEGGKVVSRTGIDVSSHNGTIDWKKVAADGIDFAYIRIGYRGTVEGNVTQDTSFEKNFSEAKAAGLDVGVYFFSQAINEDEAIEEADFVISTLGNNNPRYPIAFDMEPSSSGSDRISSLSDSKRNAAARAFCKELMSKGYNAIVYGSRSDLASYDLSDFIDYGFWFADYSDHPMMSLRLGIWQYTDSATVDGIPEKVDLDLDLMDVLSRAEAEKSEGSSTTDKRAS